MEVPEEGAWSQGDPADRTLRFPALPAPRARLGLWHQRTIHAAHRVVEVGHRPLRSSNGVGPEFCRVVRRFRGVVEGLRRVVRGFCGVVEELCRVVRGFCGVVFRFCGRPVSRLCAVIRRFRPPTPRHDPTYSACAWAHGARMTTDTTERSSSGPPRRWINRTIVGIALATCFSDFSHEMVTAVLPLYLAKVGLAKVGLGAAVLGITLTMML